VSPGEENGTGLYRHGHKSPYFSYMLYVRGEIGDQWGSRTSKTESVFFRMSPLAFLWMHAANFCCSTSTLYSACTVPLRFEHPTDGQPSSSPIPVLFGHWLFVLGTERVVTNRKRIQAQPLPHTYKNLIEQRERTRTHAWTYPFFFLSYLRAAFYNFYILLGKFNSFHPSLFFCLFLSLSFFSSF
jgi:hypothetical protein